jgi:cytochrome c oxidase subunit 2
MPRLLVLALLILAAGTVFLFAQSWLPPLSAVSGALIDDHLQRNLLLFGLLFVASHFVLAAFVWRYRDRGQVMQPAAVSNRRFEAVWTVVASLIFLGMAGHGFVIWAKADRRAPAEAYEIEVTGVQFRWYFRYAGADGRFGATRPELVDASLGNPLGIDASDPAGADDVISAMLVLPKDRPIKLTLHAQDVIHSLFVPQFRVKQDAVPGMTTHLIVTPNQTGEFDLACAELCGLGHHQMNARVRVLSEADFQDWLRERKR